MEINGQFHALATLFLGERTRDTFSIDWPPTEPVGTLDKSVVSAD